MTKFIAQQHPTECGAACVAMLAGTSLKEARKKLKPSAPTRSLRTDSAELRAALKAFGFKLGRETYSESWEALAKKTTPLLVAVNYDSIRHIWHWCVYDPRAPGAPLYDPKARGGKARKPSSATRLASYFSVTQIPQA